MRDSNNFENLDSTESRRDKCEAGLPALSREQYSIEPKTKALKTVSSIDCPRIDLYQWRNLPILQLALETSFAMSLAQKSPWLIQEIAVLSVDNQRNRCVGWFDN